RCTSTVSTAAPRRPRGCSTGGSSSGSRNWASRPTTRRSPSGRSRRPTGGSAAAGPPPIWTWAATPRGPDRGRDPDQGISAGIESVGRAGELVAGPDQQRTGAGPALVARAHRHGREVGDPGLGEGTDPVEHLVLTADQRELA